MKNFLRILILSIPFFSVALLADEQISPIGKWKTIDDKTHKEKSTVIIWLDSNGQLRGKIEDLVIKPGEDPNPKCDKCIKEHKDKQIKGMEILWGFKQEKQSDSTKWVSGQILDPNDGKIYSCNLTVDKSGKSLEVRGYIGFSFIGRSQTWIRVQ